MFKLAADRFTVRGLPSTDYSEARLWIDEVEVPRHCRHHDVDYICYWGWGKTAGRHWKESTSYTADVISTYFIADPVLARLLWPLITKLYIDQWESEQPFSQTISIHDFFLDNWLDIQ